MIKFFSNIRKKILKEGNTGKYLKYALGEIVLVVIGILIALQINNWNETNKENKAELEYLNKLYADILEMSDIYEWSLERFQEEANEAKIALKYVESNGTKASLITEFESTLLTHQTLRTFIKFSATYDEMLATGVLARLNNEALKNIISKVFNEIDIANAQIPYFRDEVGRASKIINEHVLFSYDENSDLTVTYNLNEFHSVKPLKNALVEIIDSRFDHFHYASRIAPVILEAKTMLEKELQINVQKND